MKLSIRSLSIILILVLSACKSTKFVDDGEYLLDKVTIRTNNKNIKKDELKEYIRQTPNAAVLSTWRMQLGIYNLAPKDTTSKFKRFWRKTFHKIGDPPVIYNSGLTSLSVQQLKRQLQNKGYFNANVESRIDSAHKKVRVEYLITSNQPYRLNNYDVEIRNPQLLRIARDSSRTMIRHNMIFDSDVFSAERDRITNTFRQNGYYYFNKEYLAYSADSTISNHKVNLTLEMHNQIKTQTDTAHQIIYRKYTIRKVIFYVNKDAALTDDLQDTSKLDTTQFRDFIMVTAGKRFIKLDALVQNTFINPGMTYSDKAVERTYQALSALGPVKYVNISFKESGPETLDCYVVMVPAKTVSLSTEAEGTYTEGFWGIAGNVNYVQRNVFKGAETLSLNFRGAFEKQKDVWAQEYGIQAGIRYPRFLSPVGSYDFKRNIHASTEFTTSYGYINRPSEFTTTNIGAGMSYSWINRLYRHQLQLFELSFVQFPRVDATFKAKYIDSKLYNPYNYADHFIMRTGYSGSYSNFNAARPLRNYNTARYSLETAGNILFAVSSLINAPKEADGTYKLVGVRFAQYIKGEYNTSYHQIFDRDNKMVYHIGVGIGIPYGNATEIPYEKRFYSGGANSVRGWTESQLGPGSYKRIVNASRDFNQVGDFKLDMNMEYRSKLFWIMEAALFFDAGNIWTYQKYDTQPLGDFQLNSFYKQIALAYGLGLRFDFSFFIFRFDVGMKLHDPAGSVDWKWSKPKFDNTAFHFAIGYPF